MVEKGRVVEVPVGFLSQMYSIKQHYIPERAKVDWFQSIGEWLKRHGKLQPVLRRGLALTSSNLAKDAKKAGLLIAAMIQKQLDYSKIQIAALRSSNTSAGVEKNNAEAAHRRAISVAERRIEGLQTMLISAIRHGCKSIEVFEELFQLRQDVHNELVAKGRKIAAKDLTIQI